MPLVSYKTTNLWETEYVGLPNQTQVQLATGFTYPDQTMPAPIPDEVQQTSPSPSMGTNMGPITLTPPLPSIIPPRPDQVSQAQTGSLTCTVGSFANRYPVLAGIALVGLYWVLKGGRKR